MIGEPVLPEGLDIIRDLEKWPQDHPNDAMVQAKLADLQRDPRYAGPDEPDDIMPQIPEMTEFPAPPGLRKYIGAVRTVAGASMPTSAACVAAAFNLLAAEDIDVQSRANAPHPVGLYFVVGSESGWRKSSAFREVMQGHVEADERADAMFHQDHATGEDVSEPRNKGFSPRALRQDFTIEALLTRLWKARRTMSVANSDASSLLGGWSFRKDNLDRSLSHFVNLWDGDPTSIDRRNSEVPEIFFYQRRLTALIMGQVSVAEKLLFSEAAGNGFTARSLPSIDRERPKPPEDSATSFQTALDTIAHMRELVLNRRQDQDGGVELLLGVQRRPVIPPGNRRQGPPGRGIEQVRCSRRRRRQPPRTGLLGKSPRTGGTVRRNPGLRPDSRSRDTRNLGPRPLHPGRGRPSRDGDHLARGADQVLRHAGGLGEDHPAGQRDHHDAPGEADQGGKRTTAPSRPGTSSPGWERRSSGRTQGCGTKSLTCWCPTTI